MVGPDLSHWTLPNSSFPWYPHKWCLFFSLNPSVVQVKQTCMLLPLFSTSSLHALHFKVGHFFADHTLRGISQYLQLYSKDDGRASNTIFWFPCTFSYAWLPHRHNLPQSSHLGRGPRRGPTCPWWWTRQSTSRASTPSSWASKAEGRNKFANKATPPPPCSPRGRTAVRPWRPWQWCR